MELKLHRVLLLTAFLENELKPNLVEKNCQVVAKGVNAHISCGPKCDSEKYSDDSLLIKNWCTGTGD